VRANPARARPAPCELSAVRTLASIAITLALAYLALCALLFAFQRSLIWIPQPPRSAPWAETLLLERDSVQVRITTHAGDGPHALLYFGGNAEAVAGSLPELRQVFPDHALYLLNYRGYGGSGGRPSEAAVVADALALHDLVRARHPNVTVLGRSLGTGVAIQVAAARPVSRLVLVTPFESLVSLGERLIPFVPVRWLLRDRFESGLHATGVRAPTLVLLAEHDEVIPRASSEALVRRFAPGVASVVVLQGARHNNLSLKPALVALPREPR
jgi:pimeloyl-ACP methyl ester carboxylesterase